MLFLNERQMGASIAESKSKNQWQMGLTEFIHEGNRIVRIASVTHKLFYKPRDFEIIGTSCNFFFAQSLI